MDERCEGSMVTVSGQSFVDRIQQRRKHASQDVEDLKRIEKILTEEPKLKELLILMSRTNMRAQSDFQAGGGVVVAERDVKPHVCELSGTPARQSI